MATTSLPPGGAIEPTVLDAIARYRTLVATVVGVCALLAGLAALSAGRDFEASAELVVEDPRNAAVFERPGLDSERYVETQASIMRSLAVAARVQELGAEADPPIELDIKDLLDDVSIDTAPDSSLITVTFVHPEEDVARTVPNLVAAAYAEERRAAALRSFEAAIAELDEAIIEGEAELARIEQRIVDVRGASTARQTLDEQFQDAIRRLVAIQSADTVAGQGGVPAFPSLVTQRQNLREQLDAMLAVLQIEGERPELTALRQQQVSAIDRLSSLAGRRDEMRVDAELAGSGVVLFSPARRVEQAETGLVRWVGVGITLGLLIGAGAAYFLALRRRRITVRSAPEALLGAPLLAEIPDFGNERTATPLPVADAPGSAAAEAFRFVAATIDLARRETVGGEFLAAPLVAVASAAMGDGKSTITANLALAIARQGHRVLALDADFGEQALSRLLLPFEAPSSGIVTAVADGMDVAETVYVVESSHRHALHVLPRGLGSVTAPEFFHRSDVADLFARLARQYDLVIIDTPPLLQVAYATTLVALSDTAVIVVGHDTPAAQIEALRDRLDLIGTRVRGYVYNRAPVTSEYDEGMGSLRDRLGIAEAGTAGRT